MNQKSLPKRPLTKLRGEIAQDGLNVYQYVDKFYNWRITKKLPKVGCWILMQITQTAARKKSQIKRFFNLKKKSIVHIKSVIDLAINIATTIWYLITNYEIYEAERGIITKNLRKKR